LDIPLPQERAPTLAPDELRRRQLAALTAMVMTSARVQPLVLAIEDLHWADPTTLDVLRGITERCALAPLFIVATTRPEFRPPWGVALAPRAPPAGAARPREGAENDGGGGGPPCSAARDSGQRGRAHRRRAAVCRGSYAALAGTRWAKWHPDDPADTSAIVDGTARPARPGPRGSAGWLGDWSWGLLWPTSPPHLDRRRSAASRAGAARGSRYFARPGLSA